MLNNKCCGAIRPGKYCSECGRPIQRKSRVDRLPPNPTPRVRSYIRASTTKQEMSPEVQKSRAKSFIDWLITDRTTSGRPVPTFSGHYEDYAVSGKRPFLTRPAGMQIVSDSRPGDIVVFAKLDRGFRNTIDMLQTVESLTHGGVTCCFLDINLDTSTDIGKLVITIVGAVAEFERSRISARTYEAYVEKVRCGTYSGKFAPYCTRWEGEGKARRLVADQSQRVIGKIITKLRDTDRWTFKKIADYLNDNGMRRAWARNPMWDKGLCRKFYYYEYRMHRVERHAALLGRPVPEPIPQFKISEGEGS